MIHSLLLRNEESRIAVLLDYSQLLSAAKPEPKSVEVVEGRASKCVYGPIQRIPTCNIVLQGKIQ